MKHLFTLAFVAISLSLVSQPVITKNPKDAQNCVDSCALLDVSATGSPLRFQWQQDTGTGFFNIGALDYWNDSLFVCSEGLEAPSSATYRCVVVDDNGDSVISNSATVTLDSCLEPIADFTFTFEQANVCFTNTSQNATTILWNFGDGSTDVENNETPCNDYGTAWYYDVTLYAYNDYGSDEKTMTIDLVGVEELSENFDVYPNPMSNTLYISSSISFDQVTILDMNGRVIYSQVATSQSETIDVQSLSVGIYTLVIASEESIMYHKLVKQ